MPEKPTKYAQWLRLLVAAGVLAQAPAVRAQRLPPSAHEKLEALVVSAYQQAASGFPCRAKTRGKANMLHWQEVDRCLNDAERAVDWETLSRDLEAVRLTVRNLSVPDFVSMVQASFNAHAVPYDQVLRVKDDKAHLPLTNSVLKFLPEESFQGLKVVDNSGSEVGTYSGLFSFERTGGLSSANTYTLTLFQYTNSAGAVVAPPERLLLDSFGVPWDEAKNQKGFRLRSDKLQFGR